MLGGRLQAMPLGRPCAGRQLLLDQDSPWSVGMLHPCAPHAWCWSLLLKKAAL